MSSYYFFILRFFEQSMCRKGEFGQIGRYGRQSVSVASVLSPVILYQNAGIDGNDVVTVGQQRIDVHFFDLGSEAEER